MKDNINNPVSVLYIHHAGVFGGASRSLIELISAFPNASIKPYLITQSGNVEHYAKKAGVEVITTKGISQFDNTRYSYYRGIRWIVLLRELFYLPFTFISIKKALKKWPEIQLIHINETTNLPAVIIINWLTNKPIVVHIRSVQRNANNWVTKKIFKLLHKRVHLFLAIDETVKASLPDYLNVEVTHNGFNPDGIALNSKDKTINIIREDAELVVGIVGGFTRYKGIVEFVEAAFLCKKAGLKVKFCIIGDANNAKTLKTILLDKLGLLNDVKTEIEKLIERDGLTVRDVAIYPFTTDIKNVYEQLDVLCFPSHLNAVGRPVFEAAFFGKPSIVAVRNPLPDTIIHLQTGIAIDYPTKESIFAAIDFMFKNPVQRIEMGKQAKELALKNFNTKANAAKVLNLYKSLLKL